MKSFTALLLLFITPLAFADEITVGVIAPLTGIRADAAIYTKNALDIAGRTIRQDPARKFKLRFRFEDSRYEPAAAVTAAKKLIDVERVKFIIGAYGSAETLAIAPVAEKSKVILITPGSQSEEISKAGDYIFRVIHNIAQEAPWFASFVASRTKGPVHFLYMNTGIGPSYVRLFSQSLTKDGGATGLEESYAPADSDFRPQLLRIRAHAGSQIFLVAAPSHVPLILRQADEIGLKSQFYNVGVEGPDILTAGKLAEGLLYPYSYDSTSGEPRVKWFRDEYLSRFGEEPDTVAANAFDAALLLSGCFEEGLLTPEEVKACLYRTSGFKGASGTFSIDSNGDAQKQLLVKTVKGGRFAPFIPSPKSE